MTVIDQIVCKRLISDVELATANYSVRDHAKEEIWEELMVAFNRKYSGRETDIRFRVQYKEVRVDPFKINISAMLTTYRFS